MGTDWQDALKLPGSSQIGYLKRIFEIIPWQKMVPDQSLVLNDNPENEFYILSAITVDRQLIIAYTPAGNPLKIDCSKIESGIAKAFWFNPRSGKVKKIGDFDTKISHEFKPWSDGWGSDFLLILAGEGLSVDFEELNQESTSERLSDS
jgi:hypothetical protein